MVDSAEMLPEYAPGSLSGSTLESIRTDLGSSGSFSLGDFATSLFKNRGDLLGAAGTYEKGVGYNSYFSSMANRFGLQAGASGVQADWAQLGMVFPGLQAQIIDIQENVARKQSLEKWLGRVSSTTARYAKAGVAVDAGRDTPAKAVLTLLDASQEELRYIDLDQKVRNFNEVFMPGIQAQVQTSTAQYQSEIFKINQTLSLKSAKIQSAAATTNAWIQVGGGVVKAAGAAYGAGGK